MHLRVGPEHGAIGSDRIDTSAQRRACDAMGRHVVAAMACLFVLIEPSIVLAQTAVSITTITPPAGQTNSGARCIADNGPEAFDRATGVCTAVDSDAVNASRAPDDIRAESRDAREGTGRGASPSSNEEERLVPASHGEETNKSDNRRRTSERID